MFNPETIRNTQARPCNNRTEHNNDSERHRTTSSKMKNTQTSERGRGDKRRYIVMTETQHK